MKLPLLVQARPSILVGPSVMLEKGSWRIEAKSLIDTYLNLVLGSTENTQIPIYHDKLIELVEDTSVKVAVIKSGNEGQLTIYAVRQ